MGDAVVIRGAKREERDGWIEISAEVDGERVWFKAPVDVGLTLRAEPFVAASLLEAMIREVPIQFEDDIPLSPYLYQNMPELQAVYHCWNPELKPIAIHAHLEEPDAVHGIVASCYSGGVDSSFTFVRRRENIDALILVLGFDIDGPECDWDERIERHQAFAQSMGKRLIPVKTNARKFCVGRQICWDFGHGLFLASLASMLGCRTLFVPSSHTYEQLFPWGSHPLSDPMWSTKVNRVVHCGAGSSRAEKVRTISHSQAVVDNIQVCRRSNSNNCGECPKCVRTMVALYLLGAHSKLLPDLHDMKLLSWLKPRDENGMTFLEDAMILARQQGDDDVYRRLRKYHKRYQIRQLPSMLDRMILGGFLQRLYRKIRKPEWLEQRVMLLSKNHWDC